ncbi:lytic transglycosylase domain-containing protein [Roseateles amylovorans]|uniref:Lytic transglycosylase domain-containing protein n=1 Tax=Roseateles amylovorans TaxID=2978473 RepID=A0ABY6B416_9BURK|nr:lytic transglycosylase domain-containing protein [Roseateles amylovorans]UXH78273.1 lytic transglycosylase domain-containing protein [Roseateles amylovorans]
MVVTTFVMAPMLVSAQAIGTSVAGATAQSVARPRANAGAGTDTDSDTVLRYRCTLLDGRVHTLVEDLRLRHPDLVDHCEPVRLVAQAQRIEDARDMPMPSRRAASWLTVIQGPSSRWDAPDGAPQWRAMPPALAALVQSASDRHQLDPVLVSALIFQESRYQSNARSPKGAMGLMQLMPATAARYGVTSPQDLLDPRINVDVGVRHLRSLHDRYDGRVDLMLAAYNAGEGAVSRYGNRIPPYRETEDYVRQITARVGVPGPRVSGGINANE